MHCRDCIKIWRCNVRPRTTSDSCDIVSCEAECGARFHGCKRAEHKLLCYNEKVPCINAGNGCPLWMLRRHLGRHLATCPASVVHCTMEWNRWPVCSRERQMHIPFHQPNPIARAGQLDVALALRDQRMLNEWLRAPRKTRRALRNSLTRRFPAVPLQLRTGHHSGTPPPAVSEGSQYSSSRAMTDDEEDTPWETRKAPPGLQSSVCGELYRASKQTTDSLTAALIMITTARNSRAGSVESDKENLNGLANGWASEWTKPTPLADEHMDVEKSYHHGILARHGSAADIMDLEVDGDVVSADDVYEAPGNYDVLFVDHTVVSEISSASMTDHARKAPSAVLPPSCTPPPPPPPMSPPLFVNLGLDLTLESITRYQAKPKSMYTFLCAQEFRRDEYSWHYKNVHSDIHGGLNGWLEQRCPLAHYGCMYSVRRFFPTCCGSTIIHNNILESFGVRPHIPANYPALTPPSETTTDSEVGSRRSTPSRSVRPMDVIQEMCSANDEVESVRSEATSHQRGDLVLTRLPFEVLQHVARFLDSFSLCNLSMTSRLLREVCCSLLEERGIVVQQWERVKCGKLSSWRIAYKRWFFTTSFTPIRKWGFEDQENMASHLKSCIYFQRNFKTDPYFYPVGINPNPLIYRKLKAGIDDALRRDPPQELATSAVINGTTGDNSTKL